MRNILKSFPGPQPPRKKFTIFNGHYGGGHLLPDTMHEIEKFQRLEQGIMQDKW
jgi:hypothetical protein